MLFMLVNIYDIPKLPAVLILGFKDRFYLVIYPSSTVTSH